MECKFRRLTISLSCLLFILLADINVIAQEDSLRSQINLIIDSVDAKVGIAILNLESNDTLIINGAAQYPMQSVYKFPLAVAVLHQVDKGIFSLEQKIHLSKEDMLPNAWSPITKKYPEGNVDITLSELVRYSVSESDNAACDVLFRLLGGPKQVEQYIHDLGVRDIAITTTEREMHESWSVQFTNWCTPFSMIQLLDKTFHERSTLSSKNTDLLWRWMVETPNGAKRIKGLLPVGTIVAHKPGTSGMSSDGFTMAAVNDVGLITLPNSKQIAIAVFVSNSQKKYQTNEQVIAEISKVVYDYYTQYVK